MHTSTTVAGVRATWLALQETGVPMTAMGIALMMRAVATVGDVDMMEALDEHMEVEALPYDRCAHTQA